MSTTEKLSPVLPEDVMLSGVIFEANRTFFHPLGFDMTVTKLNPDGSAHVELLKSDSPAGVIYDTGVSDKTREDLTNASKAFQALQGEKHKRRKKELGFVIQETPVEKT